MRSKRPIRAAAALAATAMLTGALAVPVANAAGAEEAQPAVTIVDNAKGRPAFSPTAITMHPNLPNGCNLVMTNTTATGHPIGYGVDRFSFKRASYLVPGGSAGWGISEPMTSYLKIVDSNSGSGVLAARCKR